MPRRREPAAPRSWAASPAELHPGSTTATQLIALLDRVLADDDRTRRAHSLLDPLLVWLSRALVAAIVVTAIAVVGLLLSGWACLVLGLYGVGPADRTLLTRLGGAGVGLGATGAIGGIITARRWWSAVRSRCRA